ncbi:hypothetical protein XENTR_v10014170 [Xenopus tropicalis]|nr:hypothetical protein XENTR_v10014170 [Xenopus tropicalis]
MEPVYLMCTLYQNTEIFWITKKWHSQEEVQLYPCLTAWAGYSRCLCKCNMGTGRAQGRAISITRCPSADLFHPNLR